MRTYLLVRLVSIFWCFTSLPVFLFLQSRRCCDGDARRKVHGGFSATPGGRGRPLPGLRSVPPGSCQKTAQTIPVVWRTKDSSSSSSGIQRRAGETRLSWADRRITAWEEQLSVGMNRVKFQPGDLQIAVYPLSTMLES